MKKGNASLVLIVILFIAAILVTYWAKRNKKTPAISPTAVSTAIKLSPTLTPTPTVEINPKTGWKIYKNVKYGFDFQHPGDWKINDIFNPQVIEPPIVEGYAEDTNTSFEINSDSKPVDSKRLKDVGITDLGQIKTFGKLTGTLYETDGIGEGGSGYRIDFIFEHNSKTYWIYLTTDLQGKMIYRDIFNQILSTFKFID